MTDLDEATQKVHYICQTYVEVMASRAKPASLKIDKQFQYSTASEAQGRAERECRSEYCVGADAYMITEDPSSGEVGLPTFLARFGTVPEADTF